MQQPVLTVGHGVKAALVHIGQLRHMVGFTGEQEALLLFLIKEGVNAGYPQLGVNAQLPVGSGADALRGNLRGEDHGSLIFVYTQGEEDVFADMNGFVQIKVLVILPVLADGEHTHIAGTVEHGFGHGLIDRGFHLCQLHADGVFGCWLVGLSPFRKNGTKALKSNLVQVFDHGNCSFLLDARRRHDNAVWFVPKRTKLYRDDIIIQDTRENGK